MGDKGCSSARLHVRDHAFGRLYLVDTGAEVSLLPGRKSSRLVLESLSQPITHASQPMVLFVKLYTSGYALLYGIFV